MAKVEIELKDGTQYFFEGKKAEAASNVYQEDELIHFGNVVIITSDNLRSYYYNDDEE